MIPLRSAVEEARLILSRHDGEHVLHNDVQALEMMAALARQGQAVELQIAENILTRMRQFDRTGCYPRRVGFALVGR